MAPAGPEQAGACDWALNEGFKSGTISLGRGRAVSPGEGVSMVSASRMNRLTDAPSRRRDNAVQLMAVKEWDPTIPAGLHFCTTHLFATHTTPRGCSKCDCALGEKVAKKWG